MPTARWHTGFEHGLHSELGSGLFGVHLGTVPTMQTSVVHTGTYAMQTPAVSGVACAARSPTLTPSTRYSLRFWWRYDAAPSVSIEVGEIAVFTSTWLLPQLMTDGTIKLSWSGGTNPVEGSAIAVAANTWHLIEITFDGNTTSYVARLRVNGVQATTDATLTGGGVATVGNIVLGCSNPHTLAATRNMYYDDVIVGTASGITDFWGDGKGILILPGSDGTHSFTANDFSTGDAGTQRAPSYTDFYLMVDDPAPWTETRDTTDNITQRVIRTTGYVEIAPGAALPGETANAVRAIMGYSSPSGTGTNLAGAEVQNSTPTTTVLYGDIGGTLQNYDLQSNNFKSGQVTIPGAGWTEAEIEAIRWRVGGASDVSPVPTWQMLALEVDYPIVAAGKAGGKTSAGILGAAKAWLAAKLGGIVTASSIGGPKTALFAKAGGITAVGRLGGAGSAGVPAISKAGGIVSAGSQGGARFVVVAKTGGMASTTSLGGARATRYGKANGIQSALALGGPKAALFARTGGVVSPARFGGTGISTFLIAKVGGFAAAIALGGSRAIRHVKASGITSPLVAGGTKSARFAKTNGIVSGISAGGARTIRHSKSAGAASPLVLGGTGAFTAGFKTGGQRSALSLGGSRVVRHAKTAGTLSSLSLGGTKAYSASKTAGIRSVFVFGGIGAKVLARAGGFTSATRLGGSRTVLSARTGGISSVGSLGGSKLWLISRTGGYVSQFALDGSRTWRAAKTAGIVAVSFLGTQPALEKLVGFIAPVKLGGTVNVVMAQLIPADAPKFLLTAGYKPELISVEDEGQAVLHSANGNYKAHLTEAK
jgi:Concanavalin A-like lectin/glucanases superfamily